MMDRRVTPGRMVPCVDMEQRLGGWLDGWWWKWGQRGKESADSPRGATQARPFAACPATQHQGGHGCCCPLK